MKKTVRTTQKLIPFLQDAVGSNFSGKYLRKVLEANLCRVNGRVERFGSVLLQKGDLVELLPVWNEVKKKKSLVFETLFEDDETLWVNKPAGFVCAEKEALLQFGKDLHLIHRLDKDTTGVLGLAKGEKAREKWFDLFASREVEKTYLAIVDGIPKEISGTIKSFLHRKKTFQGQTIWGSGTNGLEAITHWKKIASLKETSLIECTPVTGRTHQIRVHLAEMGHPIITDRQYSSSFRSKLYAARPLLHALSLKTPFFEVKAETPTDFKEALKWINSSL